MIPGTLTLPKRKSHVITLAPASRLCVGPHVGLGSRSRACTLSKEPEHKRKELLSRDPWGSRRLAGSGWLSRGRGGFPWAAGPGLPDPGGAAPGSASAGQAIETAPPTDSGGHGPSAPGARCGLAAHPQLRVLGAEMFCSAFTPTAQPQQHAVLWQPPC